MTTASPLQDYHTLPIAIPRPHNLFTSNSSDTAHPILHYLYARAHAPKIPTPDTPRSLFIANLPIDSTTPHLRALFASPRLGGARVERVDFEGDAPKASLPTDNAHGHPRKKRKRVQVTAGQDAAVAQAEADMASALAMIPETWERTVRRSGSSGVVVFVDKASLETALRGVKKAARAHARGASDHLVEWGHAVDGVAPLGYQRYLSHTTLTTPPPALFTEITNSYMAAYAAREMALARVASRARAVPDADGFVTVSRGTARAGPARIEGANAKAAELEERKRKNAAVGFYRFQVREERKREMEKARGDMERGRRVVEGLRRKRGVES